VNFASAGSGLAASLTHSPRGDCVSLHLFAGFRFGSQSWMSGHVALSGMTWDAAEGRWRSDSRAQVNAAAGRVFILRL
jgi:hypothetical protein